MGLIARSETLASSATGVSSGPALTVLGLLRKTAGRRRVSAAARRPAKPFASAPVLPFLGEPSLLDFRDAPPGRPRLPNRQPKPAFVQRFLVQQRSWINCGIAVPTCENHREQTSRSSRKIKCKGGLEEDKASSREQRTRSASSLLFRREPGAFLWVPPQNSR